MTTRLPVAVAVLVLLVTALLAGVAIHGLSDQFDEQVNRLGQVYLDGLSAALQPAMAHHDQQQMRSIMRDALASHVGVDDLQLAVVDGWGAPLSYVDRSDTNAVFAPPRNVGSSPSGIAHDPSNGTIWVWREMRDAGGGLRGQVIANLDVSDIARERARIWWMLILTGTVAGGGCACLGYWGAKRLQRPIIALTQHLQSHSRDTPQLLQITPRVSRDPEMAALYSAFNRVVEDALARESALLQIEAYERSAVLGRLSATLAHEIRNPLAGIATALRTLRAFGHQAGTREEALDFIERGVEALKHVVDATLLTYRPPDSIRKLDSTDFEDIRLLVAADARRHDIDIDISLNIWEPVELPANDMRQLLLNLVLNAIDATPPAGKVTLKAWLEAKQVYFEVADSGPGMSEELLDALTRGSELPRSGGLGLGIVVALVKRLGGHLSVTSASSGTRLTVQLMAGVGSGT